MAQALQKGDNEIFSQTGGLVYIAVEDSEKMELSVKFQKFLKSPRYIEEMPEIFDQTKNFQVPWAETETNNLILTLPKQKYDKIQDFPKFCNFINSVCTKISDFMHYTIRRQFRVVFDVQTPGGKPIPVYPIFLLMEDLDDIIFNYEKPTYAIFNLFYSLAFVCIRDNQFTKSTEVALSQLVASQLFSEFYNFDVSEHRDYIVSPLFDILWKVHKQISDAVIPTIFKNTNEEIPEEKFDDESKWVEFVLQLCHLSKFNMAKVLERIHRFPLNIATELELYPVSDIFN